MSRVKPVFPKIVDPSGVSCSNTMRPMSVSTDETRAYTAQGTAGQPLVDFDGVSNDYVAYQFVDLLHTLQIPRSDGYDESCFIVMGQVKELLFRALHFELYTRAIASTAMK